MRKRRSEPATLSEPQRRAAEEEFLFHLYRGTDLLNDDHVVEAKEELERALRVQPSDAKSQDLLAGVYFRLGMYPRAIELYQQLVEEFPHEAAVRVSLALALFKTGQPDRAAEHLEHVVRGDPSHSRAWGYLGLAWWRLGRLEEARDALLRGGQVAMARRIDEALREHPSSPQSFPAAPAPEALDGPAPPSVRPPAPAAKPPRASRAPAVASEPPPTIAQENAPAGEPTPQASASPRPASVRPTPDLAPVRPPSVIPPARMPSLRPTTLVDSFQAPMREGEDLVVHDNGMAVARTASVVFARTSLVLSAFGTVDGVPVARSNAEGKLGGLDPIARYDGPAGLVMAAPPGERFVRLDVAHEPIYLHERAIAAFDGRVHLDTSRISLGETSLDLVRITGPGHVVLVLSRRPVSLTVEAGRDAFCRAEALVGWTGRLFPDTVGSRNRGALVLRGEGVLVVA